MSDPPDAGLCVRCLHARVIQGARTAFIRCEWSRVDARFPRYPRLPVVACGAFRERGGPGGASSAPRNPPA